MSSSHPPSVLNLSAAPLDVILSTLLLNGGKQSVMIMNPDGRILLASKNRLASKDYMERDSRELAGANLKDLAPLQWAQERIAIANEAIDSARVINLLEIIDGVRHCAQFIPLTKSPNGVPIREVLVVVEPVDALDYHRIKAIDDGSKTINAKCHNLGKIDALSNRELEVLALIGQGMRIKDIAVTLHRSVKTIENHRSNIGYKLGEQDRGRLIELANLAVLQVEDASRERVPFEWTKR